MVDYDPYGGNLHRHRCERDIIDASGAVIRIGLGMGSKGVGGVCPQSGSPRLTGGTVTGTL